MSSTRDQTEESSVARTHSVLVIHALELQRSIAIICLGVSQHYFPQYYHTAIEFNSYYDHLCFDFLNSTMFLGV